MYRPTERLCQAQLCCIQKLQSFVNSKQIPVVLQQHLVHFPSGVLGHQLLKAAPVSSWHFFGDTAAALQVQLIHLLADMVLQDGAVAPDLLLEG